MIKFGQALGGLLVFIGSLSFAGGSRAPKLANFESTVIVISIDGLRPESITPTNMPHLAKWMKAGASGSLEPVFPSLTFPNHFTMATGLYPAEHGIIGNDMRDPEMTEDFTLANQALVRDPRWWLAEPFWLAAERQGIRVGAMFWPGTDVAIAGKRPSYYREFSFAVSMDERIRQMLEWIQLPSDKRPRLFTLYFEQVDFASHQKGLDSPEYFEALREVDSHLNKLNEELDHLRLLSKINWVMVSDHGMVKVDLSKTVFLRDFLKDTEADLVGKGALVGIYPRLGTSVMQTRKKLAAMKGARVFAPRELPGSYHFMGSPRLAPLYVLADEGLFLSHDAKTFVQKATHGYDHQLLSMRGYFLGRGPAFRSEAHQSVAIENINIADLVAHLAGFKMGNQHGRWTAFKSLLLEPEQKLTESGK